MPPGSPLELLPTLFQNTVSTASACQQSPPGGTSAVPPQSDVRPHDFGDTAGKFGF